MDGTLLFREDFGGNDPNDPAISRTHVPGMSSGYTQIYKLQTSDPGTDLGAGSYLVAKRGFRNSSNNNYSVWHIMDDHTYPGDTTRGYLLEIDGRGSGNDVFYSTTMTGLCAGSRLTFSAYVANLTTAGQYEAWKNNRSYVFPNLSFVITNPSTGAEIARYETGNIDHDYENYPKSWRESANWQLVGMNFIVPEGINSVRLSIRNNASGSFTGNDFALDDIEVHFCYPEGEIEGDSEVCIGSPAQLEANWEATGDMVEPFEFKWWHSLDSITWEEIGGVSSWGLTIPSVQKSDSGWYKAAMAEEGNIESVNCRTMTKPFRLSVKECAPPVPELCMDGTLLFREDFGGNDPSDSRIGQTPVSSMTYNQLLDDYFGIMRSGSYLLTKQGYCNGDTLPSNPYRGSQWHLQDDHTYPDDVTRGYLMEIDGRGDNAVFYAKTIDGLCAGTKLTFSAYVANVMTWGQYVGSPGKFAYPRLKFVLRNPATTETLATYDTGDIPFDSTYMNNYKAWQFSSQWRLVGMNFTVPDGVEAVTLSISNNTTGFTGNDFAIDDIEIRLCMPAPSIVSDPEACLDSAYTFAVDFTNDGTLAEPLEYKWWHSADSLTWTEMSGFLGAAPVINAVQETDSGWYKVAVSGAGNIESSNCRTLSELFNLKVKVCEPPPPPPCPDLRYAIRDTTVCDTLMPFTWHGLLFSEPASQTTVLQDRRGCDSLQITWRLNTRLCCPDIITLAFDTTVCDTLIPFTWHGLLFSEPATRRVIEKDTRGCDSVEHVYALDTVHCERLYPIIVNKYNWQLLCHNVRVRELFPTLTPTAYQWYENGALVPDATEDDYSEYNELQGAFQLSILMSDGTYVWSEILTIEPAETLAPGRISIYNHYGQLFYQSDGGLTLPQLPKGLYIICREYNGEQIIEKKLVP